MLIQDRTYSPDTNSYRFGFNGKEQDSEVSGQGNIYDYGFRIYNSRLGKFLSVDPLAGSFPRLSTYHYASNMPVLAIDLDGLEAIIKINSVFLSNEFCRIQEEKGTEEAVNFLMTFHGLKHTEGSMDWVGNIENGTIDEDVIVVAEKEGLPESLIVYTLNIIDESNARFVENSFNVSLDEQDDSKWYDGIVNWWNSIFHRATPPGETRRATWLEEVLDKKTRFYEVADDAKSILGWGLESNDMVEFENLKFEVDPAQNPPIIEDPYFTPEDKYKFIIEGPETTGVSWDYNYRNWPLDEKDSLLQKDIDNYEWQNDIPEY